MDEHLFDASCRWHDAGTYDAKTKTGGPNGSIRHDSELKHGANTGLNIAIEICGEISVFSGFPDSVHVYRYLHAVPVQA